MPVGKVGGLVIEAEDDWLNLFFSDFVNIPTGIQRQTHYMLNLPVPP